VGRTLFYYLLNFRADTMMTEESDGDCATYLRSLLRGGSAWSLPFHSLITENLDQLEADFKAFHFPRNRPCHLKPPTGLLLIPETMAICHIE
jgi:hypothetical protein